MDDVRRHAPATLRNRGPILDVLRRVLPPQGLVLEVASGTGEHAAFFAPRLPRLTWQPSDLAPECCASISAWAVEIGAANLLAPVVLDAEDPEWPVEGASAVVSINMIHIAPWRACRGLLRGAARILPPAGVLYLYGPFKIGGAHTAPSNDAFDQDLRARDPRWGVRDLDEVSAEAEASGFSLVETVAMPANNLSVIYHRQRLVR